MWEDACKTNNRKDLHVKDRTLEVLRTISKTQVEMVSNPSITVEYESRGISCDLASEQTDSEA